MAPTFLYARIQKNANFSSLDENDYRLGKSIAMLRIDFQPLKWMQFSLNVWCYFRENVKSPSSVFFYLSNNWQTFKPKGWSVKSDIQILSSKHVSNKRKMRYTCWRCVCFPVLSYLGIVFDKENFNQWIKRYSENARERFQQLLKKLRGKELVSSSFRLQNEIVVLCKKYHPYLE